MPEHTDPPAKPCSESSGALLQGKPVRTWLPMTLWTAGILLALGLAWFIGAEVVPILWTRSAVAACAAHLDGGGGSRIVSPREFADRIGPPPQAARRLTQYLHLPRWFAPHRKAAVTMLACCGEPAAPALTEMLQDTGESLRDLAAWGLGVSRDPRAVEPLIGALKDPCWQVRGSAAEALGVVLEPGPGVPVFFGGSLDPSYGVRGNAAGVPAGTVVPALEKALEDSSLQVRSAAADALKKIRGGEPLK